MGQGLSEKETHSFITVGGHKMQRVRNELRDPSLRENRNTRKPPSHTATDSDIEEIVAHAKTWDLEDGSACSHRRLKRFFEEPEITWLRVHGEYKVVVEAKGKRILSSIRWRQYVMALFPHVRLAKTK